MKLKLTLAVLLMGAIVFVASNAESQVPEAAPSNPQFNTSSSPALPSDDIPPTLVDEELPRSTLNPDDEPALDAGGRTGIFGNQQLSPKSSQPVKQQNPFRAGQITGSGFAPEEPSPYAPPTSALREKLSNAKTAKEEAGIVDQLNKLFDKQFEADMQRRNKELDQIKQRIHQMESLLTKRSESKKQIIQLRVQTLVNEAKGLGWSETPNVHNRPGLNNPIQTPVPVGNRNRNPSLGIFPPPKVNY